MKIALLLSFLISLSALASKEVIYGTDNRLDVFESKDSVMVELSRSTAAMIPNGNLKSKGNDTEITGKTLMSRGICESERFAKQISSANCSGFLVSEDVLVTAGHCIKDSYDCKNSKWVFDYKVESSDQGAVTVAATSVYGCSKIISRQLNPSNLDDYAVIQLERKVADRRPLAFRKSGQPALGDAMVVIGHPSGLPTKIADGANVRSLNTKFFVANLDTYGGNSGSAVFNAKTGEVEGILVRGENDYVGHGSCQVSNVCEADKCRGEDVTYITNIEAIRSLR
jgi:V8-like Glu-specific endopeptidase